jgi:hypothetical protein
MRKRRSQRTARGGRSPLFRLKGNHFLYEEEGRRDLSLWAAVIKQAKRDMESLNGPVGQKRPRALFVSEARDLLTWLGGPVSEVGSLAFICQELNVDYDYIRKALWEQGFKDLKDKLSAR